ncbi:hypothetical protein GCM10009575_063130 [Streptomyces rhizosphaericus]|uniref:Uncharacterized protein n=1 Tax=Streptomyces rhizosphaericus TaxID=114699 RepID=A0ABP4B1T1_9ACTN
MGQVLDMESVGDREVMGVRSGKPNTVLVACLDELGWSPKVLARKLNRVFGVGTVAESAPYHW